MKITLKIKDQGNAKGTIGWLAKNAASIKIGETKTGKHQGAWLKDYQENTITVLAIRSYYMDDGKIEEIERNVENAQFGALAANMVFSDAAWESIEEIIEIAAEKMNESFETGTLKISCE